MARVIPDGTKKEMIMPAPIAPTYTECLPEAVRGKPFLTLWRFNRPYFQQYTVGALLALFFSLINLGFPMVVRAIVNDLGKGNLTTNWITAYFALLMGVAIFAGIARYFQRILMIGASRKFEYALRNAYFKHILLLPARFFNRMPTGDIIARATSDINHVRDFIGPGVMGTVDMLFLPFTLGMMVYLSPRLTLIALLPLPILTLMVYIFVRFMNRQSAVVQTLFSSLSTRAQENLAGARLVRAYAIEERESSRFKQVCREYKQANVVLAAIMSFAWPLIDLLIGLALLIIVYYGGRMVITGTLALADFTAFLIVTAMLAWPLVQFGWVLTLYQRGAVSMGRISEILTEGVDISDSSNTCPDARISEGGVRFSQVFFRYGTPSNDKDEGPETWTVQNIDFEVHAGETLAIVGPTGSGKTTLISLLCREYDPHKGCITIDGLDIRRYPLAVLHAAIGCARQDSFIFSDSIEENIRLGREEVNEGQLTRACEIAQLNGDLELMARGRKTLLGERGINLSGGQKQRLNLARALANDPVVLLLDDTLSSVDTDTEHAILTGLRAVMASRTCIIVSHRLSAITHADHIIVLDQGAIVERGRHEDLIGAGGLYARMYERQLLEAQLEQEA